MSDLSDLITIEACPQYIHYAYIKLWVGVGIFLFLFLTIGLLFWWTYRND